MMSETLLEAFRGGEVDILLLVETQLQLDGDRAAAMAWDKAQLTINHGSSSFDEFLWMYGGTGGTSYIIFSVWREICTLRREKLHLAET